METKTFRKMRRFNQALDQAECVSLLKKEKRAVLAVHGENGYPYAVPVNFYYDETENSIFVHGAKEGHRVDAIRENDHVCFTVYDAGEKSKEDWSYFVRSVVVFGTAKVMTDQERAEEKARLLGLKYIPTEEETEEDMKRSFPRVLMMEIHVDHMSGKLVHEK